MTDASGSSKARVWVDDDDEISDINGLTYRKTKYPGLPDQKYQDRLNKHHELTFGKVPSWVQSYYRAKQEQKKTSATTEDADSDNEEEAADKDDVGTTKKPRLDNLHVKAVVPFNFKKMEQKHFESVDFHPSEQWALSATNSHVYIHKVDGKNNDQIKDFIFENNIKVKHAIFAQSGKEIWVAADHPGFHWCKIQDGVFKMARPSSISASQRISKFVASPCGNIVAAICVRSGTINLFSVKGKEVIGSLEHGGGVIDADFDRTGQTLYSMSITGEFYQWDIESKKCTGKYQDDGNINGSSIAVSQEYVACGSEHGIVNVYDRSKLEIGQAPAVLKTFKNITTVVDNLKFNHDGKVLAFASSRLTNSFKMVYIPLMSVQSISLSVSGRYGNCGVMAFSPNGGYFAFGFKARTSLYRLLNYETY